VIQTVTAIEHLLQALDEAIDQHHQPLAARDREPRRSNPGHSM
jgi:hypothetical protein